MYLKVLITNWLGQIEYVPVEITVRDVNDNSPQFESGVTFNVSGEVSVDSTGYKVLALTRIHDADISDVGKVHVSLENCFYTSRPGLLLTKSTGTNRSHRYPLCSAKSMRLELDSTGMLSVTLSIDELSSFLRETTDYFIGSLSGGGQSDPIIDFYLELAARDSNDLHVSVARARLELTLRGPVQPASKQHLVFKRDLATVTPSQNVHYGFKQAIYRVDLSELATSSQELIRLFNEFVWLDPDGNLHSFAPFELHFATSRGSEHVQVEANFGTVYLNQTEQVLFDVEITCRPLKRPQTVNPSQFSNVKLHSTTRLIVSIKPNELDPGSIIKRRIWTTDVLEAELAENSPIGTFLTLNSQPRRLLFDETLKLIPTSSYTLVFVTSSEEFDVEPSTGVVRSRVEVDHESQELYEMRIGVCMSTSTVLGTTDERTLLSTSSCFKHELTVRVNITNRNDNEPRFLVAKNQSTLTVLTPGEMVRAMTLFRFTAVDADEPDELSFELVLASLSDRSVLDWFELFESRGIRLSELGYDSVTKMTYAGDIELVVQVSDGLFSNRHTFWLKINHLDNKSIRSNPLAPIVLNLDIDENVVDAQCLSVSLQQTLSEYLNEAGQSVSEFELANYEAEFRVDTSGALWLRANASLDREQRDVYELLIRTRVLFSRHVEHVPSQFRVLVRLGDVNDNAPGFVGLERSRHVTLLWTDFVQSSRVKPVFTLRAIDPDLNDKITYSLHFKHTNLDIFQVCQGLSFPHRLL